MMMMMMMILQVLPLRLVLIAGVKTDAVTRNTSD